MDVARRIYLCRVAEKIDRNKNYAEKIGIKNKSKIKTENREYIGGTK